MGSPLVIQSAILIATASGVYQAPSWSAIRRIRGLCCSEAAMMFAYRESIACLSARMTIAVSPLSDPEMTADPRIFDIRYGSPVS